MDILKTSTDWAKAELFSTPFFIFFGLAFMTASLGFWQLGKTDMARAYIIPTLVAGIILATIGLGLFFTNKARVTQFEKDYNTDATAFVSSEIKRCEATLKEYKNVVFTGIPIILIACSLILLFFKTPIWRASAITAIAMLVIILLVDGTASARVEAYYKELKLAKTAMRINN